MLGTLYHWTSCSDCRRVRGALARAGLEVVERDFFQRPLGREEIEELARLGGGMSGIFSFRSPSLRGLGLERSTPVPEARLVELILEDPRRLRRPLVARSDRLLVGAPEIQDRK